METIFMNSENSKASKSHRFRLDLTEKIDLKSPKKNMVLANLSICYTLKNLKSEYNNNKFKISVPTWNDTFDLPDGSYYIGTFRIILNLSSKNTKLWLKIRQFKITPIKSKTELFPK